MREAGRLLLTHTSSNVVSERRKMHNHRNGGSSRHSGNSRNKGTSRNRDSSSRSIPVHGITIETPVAVRAEVEVEAGGDTEMAGEAVGVNRCGFHWFSPEEACALLSSPPTTVIFLGDRWGRGSCCEGESGAAESIPSEQPHASPPSPPVCAASCVT